MKNKSNASLSLRKLVLSVLATAPLATLPVPLWALPSNQTNLNNQINSISSGVTVTSTSATRVDVSSTATNSVIKWNNFGDGTNMTIGSGDTVNYALPSSSSSVLNMVTGTTSTTINGTLSSNGNIFVLNPNGVTVGATGVITANGVGLSTVPETEFTFQGTGNLAYTENQSVATSTPVNVNAGASITAASGSGNVWIAGQGATLSGTIDTGVLWVKSVRSGAVVLDGLTVGDATAHAGNVTVTTDGGTITSQNNVMVYGPSVTLTAGNANITQTGTLLIGAGSPTNASLTTNSGTGTTNLANVQVNGTGLLTVSATSSAATTIGSGAGKLAVSPELTSSLTVTSAGDLTLNAGNATAVTATSSGGNILSGGVITGTTGAVSLTAGSGKNIAYHTKAAVGGGITFTPSAGSLGTITYTQDSGDFAVPTVSAGSISVTAGNITLAGTQTLTGAATYTATGNITLGQAVSADSLKASAGIDVAQTSTVDTATNGSGSVTYTATAGNVTIGGTIGATKAPATLSVSAGKLVSVGAAVKATDASITAGTDLTTAAGGTIDGAGNVTLAATAGNVTLGAAIGGGTATKNVTITAGKNASIGSITASAGSTVSVTAGSDLTQTGTDTTGATGNVTFVATAGNVTTAAITSGNVTVTGAKLVTLGGTTTSNNGPVTVTAGTDLTQSGSIVGGTGNVSLTSTSGNVTIGAALGAGNVTINSGAQIADNAAITAVTSAKLTSTGNITIANTTLTAPELTISAPYITETGSGLIASTGNASITTTDSVGLGGANTLNNLKLVGAPNGASITEADGFTLADGTSTTGNVTVNVAGNLNLGNSAAGTVAIGKVLTVTTSSNGSVTDSSDNITVTGNVSITTTGTGSVTLDGNTGKGNGLNSSYGQVNITTANQNATVFENTTLNLGTINLGTGTLTAYSASGIINTGKLTIGGATVGAGTAAAPGSIALDYDSSSTHNAIGGTVTLMSDLGLLGSTTTIGNYLASSLTIVNGASPAALVSIPTNVYGSGSSATISLKGVNGAALNVGALNTTGAVSLQTDTGAITATNAGNTFTNVTVTSGDTAGATTVSSTKDLTVNGNISSSATGTFGFTSGGNLTIGSFGSGGSGAITFDTVTSKGSITDSAPGIFIYGGVTFQGGSVNVSKAGHNFGAITVDTSANNGNATIVEGGTSKYASVNTGSGSFTGTSTSGSIIQTGGITSTGMVTLSAVNGAVTADNAANSVGNVSITAKGDSTLVNTNDTVLGAVAIAGNLSVSTAATKNISQKSGTSIWTYGATSFVTSTTGNITLTNSGNQFGGLTLTTGSGNIAVKEATTLNLKSASTTGNFSATSENADIVDSGGLALAGAASVTLNAKNNITLTQATSDYPTAVGVKLTAGGNASITDANSIKLGTSTIGGNLTVTAKAGNISQDGVLTVGGNATFLALGATGTLTLDNTANSFGPVKFTVGSGGAVIDEATSFNLLAGSYATGAVTINTGGDFITSGTGGSSFVGNLTINAPSGSITPGAGSLLVTGTFTVNATGKKDLSLLSKSGNLAGQDPVNQGTGTYVAPAQ